MSDTTAFPLTQLPLEILHVVFRYLDVRCILRMRRVRFIFCASNARRTRSQVSRYLNEVSYSRDIWKNVYREADFVHPPGPFLWQSARDMESVLVSSFRVHRNIHRSDAASRTERATLKRRDVRYTGRLGIHHNLVFARFLVVAFRGEVRCYDLTLDSFDSNSGASIIYQSTDGMVRSFRCVSAIDTEGRPFACIVICEEIEMVTQM